MFPASHDLKQLATALRPALDLPAEARESEPQIGLARFAVERHRVGPLLHRAWFGSSDSNDSGEVQRFLATQAERNAKRELRQKAAARKFISLLAANGIAAVELKGWRLGEELYGQSSLRQSKDVDILVEPDRFADAVRLAGEGGYTLAGAEGDTGVRRALQIARHHREISVRDRQLGVEIELHSRMLGYPPPGWRDPSPEAGDASISDPDYVLYLFAHGASTGWKRLKWLCDLAMLVRRVSPEVRAQVAARARELHCEAAVTASLLVVADLWDREIVAPWLDDLNVPEDASEVRGHIDTIARRLNESGPPPFAERVLRHASIIRDTPVFGRHPPALATLRDKAMLWWLWKL